jgi:hypothetical protein
MEPLRPLLLGIDTYTYAIAPKFSAAHSYINKNVLLLPHSALTHPSFNFASINLG